MVETNLNIFDVIVFTVVGLSALFSFYRGFVRELLSLGAWVGALIITLYAFPHAKEFVGKQMDNTLVVDLISSIGVYLTALILLMILTSMMMKFLKPGKEVGALDNLLGLIFGTLRGVFMVALGFLAVTVVFEEKGYPEYIKTAVTRPYVEEATKILVKLAPEYLEDTKSIKKITDGNTTSDEPKTEGGNYQWESMDRLQKMIDEKSRGNTDE